MDDIFTLNLLYLWRDACEETINDLSTLLEPISVDTFGSWEGPAAQAARNELRLCQASFATLYRHSLSLLSLINSEIETYSYLGLRG